MARDKGQSKFSSNFEVKISEMLDPRLLVDTKEELINKETWPYDGDTLYMKEGMFVYVKGDGFYELVSLANILATDYSGWKKVTSAEGGSDVYFSDMLTLSDLRYISLGNSLAVDENVVRDFAINAKGKIVIFIEDNDESYIAFDLLTYSNDNEVQCTFTFCGHDDGDCPSIQKIYYSDGHFVADLSIGFRAYDYQPKLESGTNIKTINGVSVLGSGNIKISASSYPLVVAAALPATLSPNVYYRASNPISSNFVVRLGTSSSTEMSEFFMEFTYSSGTISFQTSIKWQNEITPTFKSGYTYQISIVNNLACFAEFKTA